MRPWLPVSAVAASGWGIERLRRKSTARLAAAAFEVLMNAIEANDRETGLHVRRVASYALILGDAAGLSDAALRELERIALFHDIGKIHEALFDIVHDGRRLTPAERREIATHPERGARVLEPLDQFYPELSRGVVAHHERWDGSGYPRGLRGTRIPLAARIVAIADVFDVIANGRRYRRRGGAEAAALEIARARGTQFDPDLVDVLLLPPILERFAEQHRAHYRRPPRGDRRHQSQESFVPDIRFRWRSASAAR